VLTVDLVNARRKGKELSLVRMKEDARARALSIAITMLESVQSLEAGATRSDVEEALRGVEADARDQKVKAGLVKLCLDRCAFEAEAAMEPEALRREVFEHAAKARKNGSFVREEILAGIALAREVTALAIEDALFSDLRAAHKLLSFDKIAPASLLAIYEHGQAQAVLLRATKIVVDVTAAPGAMRALFHKLKFLRLLFVIEKQEKGHRITIDGPCSLFESATKYGLELAMMLPALDSCDAWSLEAEVLWGKDRSPLVFRLQRETDEANESPKRTRAPTWLADDVKELAAAIEKADATWSVRPANTILELRGVGLCVPDLELTRDGRTVYVESMGYWSRDAVWKRVELVQAGLSAPIVFAVSERLRVSEAVLPADAPAALYVYKGTMHARAVLERVTKLWEQAPRA